MSSRVENGSEPARLRHHGGIIEDEIDGVGLATHDVLDFSVNVNPYGPSAAIVAAIRSAPIDRYPDPTSRAARRAIGEAIGVRPDAIVVGNGAVELMWTIARAFVSPGTPVVIVEPTFSEFRAAVTLAGARVVEWRARESEQFAVDLEAVEKCVQNTCARLVYLCSPANPTGRSLPIAALAAMAKRNEGSLFVLDQSFLTLSENHEEAYFALPPNVIRVRSLTKDHAIPGLRAGYLATTEAIASRIESSRPPWTTSAPAQAAIVAAMREGAFVAACRARLLENRKRLATRLEGLGFETFPSSTVYLLFRARVDDADDAAALRARLLRRDRVLVRDCTSFGLPSHIRVCARPLEDENELIVALGKETPAKERRP